MVPPRALQTFRFLSLAFTALILGAAFCHVLEMPVKLSLSAEDYMVVQQIYGGFGPAGALLEPAAILSTAVLAYLARGRRSFVPALVGALALAVALVAWFTIVNPVNAHWAAAGPRRVPAGFDALRTRWEWGHAVHALLLFAGFVALIVATLVEIPRRGDAVGGGRSATERAA